MIDLQKHNLARLDALAAHTGKSDVDILTECIMELGPAPTPGELTDWLYQASRTAGLEPAAHFVDKPEAIKAWQAIEDAWDWGQP